MTRTLRGAWTRRRALAPLGVLATALVASLTAALAHARAAGDVALVGPLVLLGAVVLSAPARAVAADRRDELALGRLRGRGGPALVAQLLAEPVLALVLGGLVGLGAGLALAPQAGALSVAVLVVVVAAGALAVAVTLAARLREPLAEQVVPTARPRASSTAATFAGLVVLAAAGYAVFAAHQRPAGPRWLLDLAPALVGLAAGQALVWVLRGLARLAVPRSGASAPAVFLAVRRLARRAGTLTPLGLVVAAAVVATVGATAAHTTRDWVDQTARLRAGAAVQVRLHGTGAAQALVLTHRLDPQGRWLMAAVVLPPQGRGRSVLVDSARLARVAGPTLAGTPGAPVAALAARLGRGPEPARGRSARLAGRVVGPVPARLRVRVDYVTDTNFVATRSIVVRPAASGALAAQTPVPGCVGGCVPTAVTVDATGGGRGPGKATAAGTVVLDRLDFAGTDLPRLFGPRLARFPLAAPPDGLRPVTAPRGVPALTTPVTTAADATVQGPDGGTRPAAARGRVAALPLAGTRGTLADLPTALVGALPTSPSTDVLVLARDGTPPRLLRALPGRAVTLARLHHRVDRTSGAARARTALLVGLCSLLVAGLGLVAGLARQRREVAQEVAALRVVGYPVDRLRPSVGVEMLACGLAALAAVVLGSMLTVGLVLARMPLLDVPASAPAPDFGAPGWLLLAGGAVALLLVAGVVGRGRAVPERASRPARLREEGLA